MEEQSNITPKEDLMKSALEHYKELSNSACSFNSDIPKAIKAYYNTPSVTDEEIPEIVEEIMKGVVGANSKRAGNTLRSGIIMALKWMRDKHLPSKGDEWISVEDKLPELGMSVLTHKDFGIDGNYEIVIDSYSDKWFYDSKDDYYITTHWMPIPELKQALKEKGDSDD